MNLISLSNESRVLPEIRASFTTSSDDSEYYYEEDLAKVCRSGYVNKTEGICAQGVKSLNKGQPCSSETDCPTTDSNVYASCKCGFNSKGTKYCDISAGDDEWVSAFEQF